MYITQCPHCQTRFKVQSDQLDVCDGQVRCGRCNHVFNAREALEPDGPLPATAPEATALVPAPVAEPVATLPAATQSPAAPAAPPTPPSPAPTAAARSTLPAAADHLVKALANAPELDWHPPAITDDPRLIALPKDQELDRISGGISLDLPDFTADLPAAPAANAPPREPSFDSFPPRSTTPPRPAPAPAKPSPAAPIEPVFTPAEEDDDFLKKLQAARQQQTNPSARVEPSLSGNDSKTSPAKPRPPQPEVIPDDPPVAKAGGKSAPSFSALSDDGGGADEGGVVFRASANSSGKAPAPKPEKPPRKPLKLNLMWVWLALSAVGALGLAGQATYLFRTEIAAQLPGARAPLELACRSLGCTVPLPKHTELLRTEWSELAVVPEQANLIRVSATVRNLAAYPQAYPNLELSLKDGEDHVLSKKVLLPKDYLNKTDAALGQFNGNSEVKVFMQLDVGMLRPKGYALMWFYP